MNVSLKSLFLKYKIQILFTFLLLSIESFLLVIIPFSIGKAIDTLQNDSYLGIYILMAVLFSILLISTSRRLYDTRVYSKIYTLLSTSVIKDQKRRTIDTSKILTRSNLIKELVDFFEHDLTEAYTAFIGVLGALIMLWYINTYVFIICLSVIFLIYFVYSLSEKNIFNENSELNTELEKRLNIIREKNSLLISHFKRISKNMIRLSDIESYNYILIQILIAFVIIGALFIGVKAKLSTGEIFAMLTYVLNFSFEVLTLPIIFGQTIRLKEIIYRINKG